MELTMQILAALRLHAVSDKAAGRKFLQELGLKSNITPQVTYGLGHTLLYSANKSADVLVKEMSKAKFVHLKDKRRYEAQFPHGTVKVFDIAPGMAQIEIVDTGIKEKSKSAYS
ncbi:hypothetical protein [Achromobacter phage Motura]|uniref:Uncharacterized protein n=1 Tax=Achromobacter phage Motura TaxID=2591403 RepID=A0A514CT35_9CAUD|nr:hypothetical protein H1O15_gp164 [Achromobacter phage Motura]QDH83624.1 hypothetical protein [Achromobacter phage Motura]